MTADYIIHHWYIDFASGTLLHQESGEQRRLGEYQLKLLQVLAEHAGKILSRDELNTLVWERRVIGNNSLPNAIHALRVALEDDGKQQRIIKTIPKKGYILEAEFCQRVSPSDLDALAVITLQPDEAAPPAGTLPEGSEPQREAASASVSPPQTQPETAALRTEHQRWFWLVPVQALLLLALLVWISGSWFSSPRTALKQQDASLYSNISLRELIHSGDPSATAELNKQLGTTLYMLNQHLKNQQVKMDVIYGFSGTSLNYTMTLHNTCGRKQLAMKILNWRINGTLLSALIYRESERKLNEMANCVN